MEDAVIEDIYYTLVGEMEPEYRVPGVEDAFAPGGVCDLAYACLAAACDRLRAHPGVDEDVETVLMAALEIRKDLCLRMFRLGRRFAGGQ